MSRYLIFRPRQGVHGVRSVSSRQRIQVAYAMSTTHLPMKECASGSRAKLRYRYCGMVSPAACKYSACLYCTAICVSRGQ
jgi:hypothetical protein